MSPDSSSCGVSELKSSNRTGCYQAVAVVPSADRRCSRVRMRTDTLYFRRLFVGPGAKSERCLRGECHILIIAAEDPDESEEAVRA